MKLLGSTTSPFARRIRVYLADKDYQFINLDIFAENDRKLLTENNPAQKIPALLDDGKSIYDSRVIYRYLSEKFEDSKLTWSEENLLTLIDSVNDALVSILIMKRSGFDTTQDALFFNLQHERTNTVFTVLNDEVANGAFQEWQYPAICLWCLLDWVEFRELANWRKFPELVSFYQQHQALSILSDTDPRG